MVSQWTSENDLNLFSIGAYCILIVRLRKIVVSSYIPESNAIKLSYIKHQYSFVMS